MAAYGQPENCSEKVSLPVKSKKRCGWLFNTAFTIFFIYSIFVDYGFSEPKTQGTGDLDNLSRLPCFLGHPNMLMIADLTLLAIFIVGLCAAISSTWNRLVLRFLPLSEISIGEAYTIILWIFFIGFLVGRGPWL